MPSSWRLIVSGIDHRRVRCHHLHAAMCLLLDSPEPFDSLSDPAATAPPAPAGHHATRKPWSVGPIQGDRRTVFLTVRTLSDQTTELLHDRAQVGCRVVLNRQEGVLVRPPQLLASAEWADLARPTTASAWRLDFMSPTSLSSNSRYSPLIEPSSLIGSLLRRWRSLTDVWLPRLTPQELSALWVSDIDGHTVVERVPHGRVDKVVPGFVGTVGLRADHPAVAAATDCMLRFAEFAGVGALVTHGLGTVRLTPLAPTRTRPNRGHRNLLGSPSEPTDRTAQPAAADAG
ncbi:MAG: CRISPR system precrRNA processing endoribonuclease RAMP protein Cas6 [Propionibacteriaceae bacterium]|jgi:hypothetical protein|nr:CRISPR system precrRNA processing endoribonuclease RAMP protein Cas6 [Propionibacteriaceae bacterium]